LLEQRGERPDEAVGEQNAEEGSDQRLAIISPSSEGGLPTELIVCTNAHHRGHDAESGQAVGGLLYRAGGTISSW